MPREVIHGQSELQAIIARLEAFAPQMVAVEYPYEKRQILRTAYNPYLAGEPDLSSGNIANVRHLNRIRSRPDNVSRMKPLPNPDVTYPTFDLAEPGAALTDAGKSD